MRISDWSSDVCSSDLMPFSEVFARGLAPGRHVIGNAHLQGPVLRVVSHLPRRHAGSAELAGRAGRRNDDREGQLFRHHLAYNIAESHTRLRLYPRRLRIHQFTIDVRVRAVSSIPSLRIAAEERVGKE